MTTCQTITLDFDEEMRQTRKLLERVPLGNGHSEFRPHAKSMPLDRLASHVAELPSWAKYALETEVLELTPDFKPTIAASTEELLAMFDKSVEEGRAAIATASDNDMRKTWTFKYNGEPVFSGLRTHVIRSFLNHLIHHRAQLGVYLRLNEIPVPGMYGPSADESFAAAA